MKKNHRSAVLLGIADGSQGSEPWKGEKSKVRQIALGVYLTCWE